MTNTNMSSKTIKNDNVAKPPYLGYS